MCVGFSMFNSRNFLFVFALYEDSVSFSSDLLFPLSLGEARAFHSSET